MAEAAEPEPEAREEWRNGAAGAGGAARRGDSFSR